MITPAPVQTSYTQYQPIGQVGLVADGSLSNIDTRIAESPSLAGIGFGLAVCQGTLRGDKAATLGQLSGGVFLGVTVADVSRGRFEGDTGPDKYADGENMAVLSVGDIWVAPSTTVAAGGNVYFNSVTGQFGPSSISNAVQVVNARWETSYPNPDSLVSNPNHVAIIRLTGKE